MLFISVFFTLPRLAGTNVHAGAGGVAGVRSLVLGVGCTGHIAPFASDQGAVCVGPTWACGRSSGS